MNNDVLEQIMSGVKSSVLGGLQAAGVDVSDPDSGSYLDDVGSAKEGNSPLTSWNATQVKVPKATDRPKIWDMSTIEDGNENQDKAAMGSDAPREAGLAGGAAPTPVPQNQSKAYYAPDEEDESVAPYAAGA
jgi:hypothetical protein